MTCECGFTVEETQAGWVVLLNGFFMAGAFATKEAAEDRMLNGYGHRHFGREL